MTEEIIQDLGKSSKNTSKKTREENLKVLECRVCEEVFGLQGDKVPRLLYCGHTVCHSCLMRLPLRDNYIQCPFDRQSTPTGNSGVWGLKKNFALLELLERLQIEAKDTRTLVSVSVQLNSDHEYAYKCDENEAHIAVLFCTVCASNLCKECSESSHSTKTLVKHRRVPISDKPKEKPKCPLHPSHIAEFTCLEDDCKSGPILPLMCFICKDYGRHKTHKHSLVEAEAESIKTTVNMAIARMKIFMETINDSAYKIEQVIQQMEGTENNPGTGLMAKAKVRVHFEDLRRTLQLQEQAAIAAVDSHLRERLSSLRQTQEDLTTALAQMAAVCVQCEQTVQFEDSRIVLASKELEDALTSVQKIQSQFSEVHAELPDSSVPITFTKDNRVHIGPKIEVRVVTLGLDGAGKTSILFKLKQNEFMTMIPTIGFNVETIEYKNIKFTVWDVGGQPKLRPLWKHYYFNTQAVVFVIDSSDTERLPDVYTELAKLLSEKELADAAFLLLANKQDLEEVISIESLTETLSLQKLCCGRSWHVEACSSQTGQGLIEGLDWLARQLIN